MANCSNCGKNLPESFANEVIENVKNIDDVKISIEQHYGNTEIKIFNPGDDNGYYSVLEINGRHKLKPSGYHCGDHMFWEYRIYTNHCEDLFASGEIDSIEKLNKVITLYKKFNW